MAGRRKRSAEDAPALDISSLQVEDVDPASVQWRESTAQPSPLQDSFDASANGLPGGAGHPKTITVANEDEAKQVVNAIRRAAKFRDLGSKVKTENTDDGRVRVMFSAKPRKAGRKYTSRSGSRVGARAGFDVPEKGRVTRTSSRRTGKLTASDRRLCHRDAPLAYELVGRPHLLRKLAND